MNDSTEIQKQYAVVMKAIAQEEKRLRFSDSLFKWNDSITATFAIPKSSPFASLNNRDTLFLFVHLTTFHGKQTLCLPMKPTSDTSLAASFYIPDSVRTISTNIYTVNKKIWPLRFGCSLPCSDREGNHLIESHDDEIPTSIAQYENELSENLRNHPGNFGFVSNAFEWFQQYSWMGFIKTSADSVHYELLESVKRIEATPQNSAGKYLALAKMYSQLQYYSEKTRGDSGEAANLSLAAGTDGKDSIFDDDFFWQRMRMNKKYWRILTPLAVRYPHTTLANYWIQTESADSNADPISFNSIASAWENDVNTGILTTIGRGYDYPGTPMFNPEKALLWLGKAETNIQAHAGFYDAADLYGSTSDQLPYVQRSIVVALARAGMPDSAITLGQQAFSLTSSIQHKIGLQLAMADAYVAKNDTSNADKCTGIAIALNGGKKDAGIETVYEKCKWQNESVDGFVKRVLNEYGNDVPNPLQFDRTSLDGKHWNLRSLQGKVIFLDFWFIGCEGCEMEKQSISDLADKYKKNKNIVFLSVSLNDKSQLERYLSGVTFDLPVIADEDGNIADKFGVESYPTHIIIGKDGKIFDTSVGGSSTISDELIPKIESAFAQK